MTLICGLPAHRSSVRSMFVLLRTERMLFCALCDPAWQVIKITPLGWSVVQSPPVRFRRTSGMRALPLLERGKPIKALRPFLNVSDNDFTLAVGFIVTALRPFSKYPIFVAYGEQGSAK